MNKIVILSFVMFSLLMACSDHSHHTHNHEEETFQGHIDHVEEHYNGPFVNVALSANKDNAPDVSTAHTCYQVTVQAAEGWLSYVVDDHREGIEKTIYLDKAGIAVQVFNKDNIEVTAEIVDLSTVTTKFIQSGFSFHGLVAGQQYHIKLNGVPTSTPIKVSIEHTFGDDHNHEN